MVDCSKLGPLVCVNLAEDRESSISISSKGWKAILPLAWESVFTRECLHSTYFPPKWAWARHFSLVTIFVQLRFGRSFGESKMSVNSSSRRLRDD